MSSIIQEPIKDLNLSPPDPLAKSTPPAPIYRIVSLLSLTAFIVSIPILIPYITFKHYLLGPPVSWMTLHSHIVSRLIKHYFRLNFSFFLPPVDKKEWINKPTYAFKARKGTEVEMVTLSPVPDEMRTGIAICERIKTIKRPGFWVTPQASLGRGDEPAKDGEKVILYIHGGAYVFGHPTQTPFAASTARITNLRILGVNYRKPVNASQAFPAPLLDALAGYLHLINLNFKPVNVAILGDSAGAHLTLMLSRYLSSLDLPNLSQPGHLLLSSPWVDFTHSFPSIQTNYKTDYLSRLSRILIPSSLRYYPRDAVGNLYFSPALGKPKDFEYLEKAGTKVYIQVGTKEVLYDEIMAFGRLLKGAGVDVLVREEFEGLHCGAITKFDGSNAWDVWKKDLQERLGV